jgi:pimeloyl-ACP methyl ester carboxylesterase
LEINYYESQGTGPAILMVHGNSSAGRTFYNQLEGSFGQKYRVVALDLPGHGHSARANDPQATYNMPGYARVVVDLARQLNLDEAVFLGWSLGGHIVLEATGQLPQAKGFVIYGTPPVGKPPAMAQAFLPNPNMAAAFQASLTEQEISGFGEASLKPGAAPDRAFYEDMALTDGKAREFMGASVGAGNYTDEVEIVANLTQPLAILQGEHEQLVSEPYISSLKIPALWRGSVQIIKDAGHSPHFEQPAAFNALLEAFIAEAAK